jgi:pyridoxamine--pyruvate transaminase
MGPTAGGLHSIVGLAALGRTLADLGVNVDIAAGLEKALAVLSTQRN